MTGARLAFAHATIATLFGGSAYAIVEDCDAWPFSSYPMYSYIDSSRAVTRLELVGVASDRGGGEVALRIMKEIPPWDDTRLMASLRRLLHGSDAELAVRKALKELLTRYEDLRAAGKHDGPRLRGLRLYELTWKNISPGTPGSRPPDQRELVGVVEQ